MQNVTTIGIGLAKNNIRKNQKKAIQNSDVVRKRVSLSGVLFLEKTA